MKILRILFTLAGFSLSVHAWALPIEDCLSEREFTALAEKTSHKVNLFQEVWLADPNAEFYGGTSRDYLYWVLRQFRGASSREDCLKIVRRVEKMPIVDVRDFMHGDSDVDVISSKSSLPVEPVDFGVRKIDGLSPALLDPRTPEGFNEYNQGYIPAEKIRLTSSGIKTLSGQENGIHELYSGELTVHFAEESVFWKTAYAQAKENHPILLSLRYIRILAQDYYQRHGTEYETDIALDPAIDRQINRIVESVTDGKSLKPFLKQSRFATWLNGSIAKSFRSSANPTAALWLLQHFRINELVGVYPEIKPFNTYLFHKRRDEKQILKNFRKFGVSSEDVYSDVSNVLSDRKLFHGTRSEEGFKSILLEGIIPSDSGSAAAGVYGVAEKNVSFAIKWGGAKDRVVVLSLAPETKLVDITRGPGLKLWKAFQEKFPKADEDLFCETFGIDLLRYPYAPTAFALKNSAVVTAVSGYTRNIKPLTEILAEAETVSDVKSFVDLSKQFTLYPRTTAELRAYTNAFKQMDLIVQELRSMAETKRNKFLLSIGALRGPILDGSADLKTSFQEHLKAVFNAAKTEKDLSALLYKLSEKNIVFDMGSADTLEFLKLPVFSELAQMKVSYLDWQEMLKLFSDPKSWIVLTEHWEKQPIKDGYAKRNGIESGLYELIEKRMGRTGMDPDFCEALAKHIVKTGTFYLDLEIDGVPGIENLGKALRLECLATRSCLEYVDKMQVGLAKTLLVEQLFEQGDFSLEKLDLSVSKKLLPIENQLKEHEYESAILEFLFSKLADRKDSLKMRSMREIFTHFLRSVEIGGVYTRAYRSAYAGRNTGFLESLPDHWLRSDVAADAVSDLLGRGMDEAKIFYAFSQMQFPKGFAGTPAFKRGMDLLSREIARLLLTKFDPAELDEPLIYYTLFLMDENILLGSPDPKWYEGVLRFFREHPEIRHEQMGDPVIGIASELTELGKEGENPKEYAVTIYRKLLALGRIAPTSQQAMKDALKIVSKRSLASDSPEFQQLTAFLAKAADAVCPDLLHRKNKGGR